MTLRKYAVTVMDNWTPMRFFFTLRSAEKFYDRNADCAHLFRWAGSWQEIKR